MKNTKDLTVGAMFGAIYGVLLLLIRYLLPSTDSLIYYFIPLPIAIYTYWKGNKNGLVLLVVLSLLSFLICDPLRAILLLIPNYILGVIFGILKKKNKGLTIITTFILALLINFLSLYAFELLTGISYFNSTLTEMSFMLDLFPNLDDSLFTKVLFIVIPIVLILDSLLKTILLNILFVFMLNRLKIDDANMKFEFIYSYWYGIIYMCIFLLSLLYIGIGLEKLNSIISIVVLSIFFIVSIMMIFLGAIGLKLYLMERNKKPNLLVIFSTIIFPISLIFGIVFSFKYNNKRIILG